MGIELSDSLSSIPMLTRRSEHWLDVEIELEERSDLWVSEAQVIILHNRCIRS